MRSYKEKRDGKEEKRGSLSDVNKTKGQWEQRKDELTSNY